MRRLVAILVGLALAVLPATFGHAASPLQTASADCPHRAAAPMDRAHHGGKLPAPMPRAHADLCCFSTCVIPGLAVPDAAAVLFPAGERRLASDDRTVANIVEPAVPPPRA